jgi:hypothetical protein
VGSRRQVAEEEARRSRLPRKAGNRGMSRVIRHDRRQLKGPPKKEGGFAGSNFRVDSLSALPPSARPPLYTYCRLPLPTSPDAHVGITTPGIDAGLHLSSLCYVKPLTYRVHLDPFGPLRPRWYRARDLWYLHRARQLGRPALRHSPCPPPGRRGRRDTHPHPCPARARDKGVRHHLPRRDQAAVRQVGACGDARAGQGRGAPAADGGDGGDGGGDGGYDERDDRYSVDRPVRRRQGRDLLQDCKVRGTCRVCALPRIYMLNHAHRSFNVHEELLDGPIRQVRCWDPVLLSILNFLSWFFVVSAANVTRKRAEGLL